MIIKDNLLEQGYFQTWDRIIKNSASIFILLKIDNYIIL